MDSPRLSIPGRARSKYRNVRVEVNGVIFDSKREARRWEELRLLERAGQIQGLVRQVRMPLTVVNEQTQVKTIVTRYIADFAYTENEKPVIEDSKGFKTDIYRLKKKMVMAQYGIEIRET